MKEITIINSNQAARLFYSKKVCAFKSIFFSVYPIDNDLQKQIGNSKSFIFNGEDISWDGPVNSELLINIAKAITVNEELWKFRERFRSNTIHI